MFKELQLQQLEAALPEEQCVSVPNVEKLTVNYRTHNGILGCAAELVEVILSLFPNAVDRLEKDRGHFNGPKPQLLTETSTDDLAILLLGSDPAQSQIEFGAHQAVLVRSQAAKATLPSEFDGALVLTIFESKGLEFDDVFIYSARRQAPSGIGTAPSATLASTPSPVRLPSCSFIRALCQTSSPIRPRTRRRGAS